MSASSSTIRMSCAMGNRTQLGGGIGLDGASGGAAFTGENKPHSRAPRLAILQHQLSQMIFHDLLDDGEAQAGALGAGCYVGLGQALAILPRQALAVVLDDDRQL